LEQIMLHTNYVQP